MRIYTCHMPQGKKHIFDFDKLMEINERKQESKRKMVTLLSSQDK